MAAIISPSSTLPSAALAGRAIGAMFFSIFGGAWLGLWAYSEFTGSIAAVIPVIAGTAFLLWRARLTYKANAPAMHREKNSPQSKKRQRIFNLINAAQWLAVFAVAGLLSMTGHAALILPAVIFIIGVHFIPLARLFMYKPHYVTGLSLVILAIGYPLLAAEGPTSGIGALGAGLILWFSAGWALSPYSQSVALPGDVV